MSTYTLIFYRKNGTIHRREYRSQPHAHERFGYYATHRFVSFLNDVVQLVGPDRSVIATRFFRQPNGWDD